MQKVLLAYKPLHIAYFQVQLTMQPNVQYACRKTLADSRPRVRGRFAKNDDFGETNRTTSSNHEDDDEEEVRFPRLIDLLNNT